MKTRVRSLNKLVLGLAVGLSSILAEAAIPQINFFDEFNVINAKTKELNLSILERVEQMNMSSRFDPSDFIPYESLNNRDTAERITGRILRHTIQCWLSKENYKNSDIVKSAKSVNSS